MSLLKSLSAFAAAAAVSASVSIAWADGLGNGSSAVDQDLPDLGSPATAAVSLDEEYQVGLGWFAQMRKQRTDPRRSRGQRLHSGNRPQPVEPRRGRAASVLLLRAEGPHRQRLRHAGQVSSPSKRLDPGDPKRERAGRRDGPRDRARHPTASGAATHGSKSCRAHVHRRDVGRHHIGRDRGPRRSGRHGGSHPRHSERRHSAPDQLHAGQRIRGRPNRYRHHGDRRIRSVGHGQLFRLHVARAGRSRAASMPSSS